MEGLIQIFLPTWKRLITAGSSGGEGTVSGVFLLLWCCTVAAAFLGRHRFVNSSSSIATTSSFSASIFLCIHFSLFSAPVSVSILSLVFRISSQLAPWQCLLHSVLLLLSSGAVPHFCESVPHSLLFRSVPRVSLCPPTCVDARPFLNSPSERSLENFFADPWFFLTDLLQRALHSFLFSCS